MKITVLGSCSGTEPYPHRHQTSVAIETGGRVYFIDAGENAGYASYLGGIPQQDTAAIFITHTHMDHTGGLPHLLWNFRKLCTINQDIAAHMEGKVIIASLAGKRQCLFLTFSARVLCCNYIISGKDEDLEDHCFGQLLRHRALSPPSSNLRGH